MTAAFQGGAFQINAFQTPIAAYFSAFQSGGFQGDAFQITGGAAYTASAAMGSAHGILSTAAMIGRMSAGILADASGLVVNSTIIALNGVMTIGAIGAAASPGTAQQIALIPVLGSIGGVNASGGGGVRVGDGIMSGIAGAGAAAAQYYLVSLSLSGRASVLSSVVVLDGAAALLGSAVTASLLSVVGGANAAAPIAEVGGIAITAFLGGVTAASLGSANGWTGAARVTINGAPASIGAAAGAFSPGQHSMLAIQTLGEQSSNVAAAANTTAKPQSSLGETAGAASTNVTVTEGAAAALVSASAELIHPFSGETNFASLNMKGRVTGDGIVTTPALTIPFMGVAFTTTGNGAGGMAALIPPQGTVEWLGVPQVAVNAKPITPMKDAAMGAVSTARQVGLGPADISAAAGASGANVALWQTLGIVGVASRVTSNGTGLYPVAVMVNTAIALSAIAQRVTAATVAAFASLDGISGQGAATERPAATVGGVAGVSTAATANKAALAVHTATAGEQATASQSGAIVQSIIAALNWAGVGARQIKATVPALGTADSLAGVGNRVTAAPVSIGGVIVGQGAAAVTNAQPAALFTAAAGATAGPVGFIGRALHTFGVRLITAFDYARLLFSTNNSLQSIRPRVRTLASASKRRRSLSRAQARIRSLP
jgi:hypothetical protein